MKMGFFSGTIAPPKSRKHVPTPIWIRENNGRRLVKIEDTHQEEEFQVEEPSQATMAAPISDKLHKRYSRQWKNKVTFSKRWEVASLSSRKRS